jgi:hypothetical protein
MTYLAEFWLILESVLVESAPHKIFDEMIKNYYTEYYILYQNRHIWSHCIWICYEEVMTFLPETPDFD